MNKFALSVRPVVTVLAAGLALASPALAQVHETDVIVRIVQGRLETGRVEAGQPVFPRQVNGSTLGLIGIPNVSTDPGFDSPAGTFTPGQVVGLSLRRALRKWDGAGFSTIPAERLQVVKGQSSITTPEADPTAGSPSGSLILGVATSSGRLHEHPAWVLLSPASAGVYMVELELWMTAPGTGTSEPVWILLNQNAPPAVYDEAFAWADANVRSITCVANCDGSTGSPVLTPADFVCFRGFG
ncbi:hypothetical protein J4558_27740 [Leptolyngbya sp. 15MV]|nr:hypothetical protein J4558_27740 [Leptolyngbya sp. 15MV]